MRRSRPEGTVVGRSRIVDVIDKGAGKGALIYSERRIVDRASGRLLATINQTTFCRADGGFGGEKREAPAPHVLPERAPDLSCDLATRPEMALIYRLSGDVNPLHAEPAFAREAGYPRPILHGLATFGVAGHALLKTVCGYDPARLTAMAGRFSAPVYPGETIRTEIWRDGDCRELPRPRPRARRGRHQQRPGGDRVSRRRASPSCVLRPRLYK